MRFERKDLKLSDASHRAIIENAFEAIPNGYKPFSYYVLGGIDVSGDVLNLSGNPESDSAGDMESANGAGPGYDPRVSGFDIAEQSGIEAYQEAIERSRTAAKSSESSESSEFSESSESPESSE